MKKKFFVTFLLVFLLTGCTLVRIDTTNIDSMVDVVLSKDNTLYNRVGIGYKYYVPRGVIYIDSRGRRTYLIKSNIPKLLRSW